MKKVKRVALGVYDTRYETARFVNNIPDKKVYVMQASVMQISIPAKVIGKKFRLIAEVLE